MKKETKIRNLGSKIRRFSSGILPGFYLFPVFFLLLPGLVACGEKRDLEDATELESEVVEAMEQDVFQFLDAFGEMHETVIAENAKMQDYDLNCFQKEESSGLLTYQGDERYQSLKGIDVSYHQGEIDWAKVKEAGIDFAIIRLGYRGYGEAGALKVDDRFQKNIKEAKEAGPLVGVYFFSQAINEEEAIEEADLCIKQLNEAGIALDLPVVYDPESILDVESRTDQVTGEQFTANSIAFCEHIKEAGFSTMIYANMMWEAYELDMLSLQDYDFWYADYEALPQTPYDFSIWQYSESGQIPGIEGNVDLNIYLYQEIYLEAKEKEIVLKD